MKITNQIILGDTIDILKQISKETFQLIIADPPYYNVLVDEEWDTQWQTETDYLEWCLQWGSECFRVLKSNGLFFCFGQLGKREHVFIHLMHKFCKEFQFHDLIIWDRLVGYNDRKDSFTPAYEMILALRKSNKEVLFNKDAIRIPYPEETISTYMKDKRYKDKAARMAHLQKGKYSTNILSVPSLKGTSKERCGHPSQKPLQLIEKLVLSSTNKNDLVLDPFLGSGTTAVASQKLGRKYTGIEINPKYVSIAKKRLQSENFSLF